MSAKILSDLQKEQLQRCKRSELKFLKGRKNDNTLILAFYAEKGGVGKTTLCNTLAHVFAQKDERVLIYDCDPQRSLTSWVFGNEINIYFGGDIEAFIRSDYCSIYHNDGQREAPKTLYEQVELVRNDGGTHAAVVKQVEKNLFLVAGDRNLDQLNEKISFIESLSSAGLANNKMTLAPYECVKKTAEMINAKYVFFDLNPNKGTLNRCLIMTSNYLILPAIPDFFSQETMNLIRMDLLAWSAKMVELKKLPDRPVKFLGYILNRYAHCRTHNLGFSNGVYQDQLRKNEKFWFERVQNGADRITSELSVLNPPLAISPITYQNSGCINLIGKVREFWGLAELSDLFHVPVPFLTREHLVKRQTTNEDDDNEATFSPMPEREAGEKLRSIEEWRLIFDHIYKNILKIIHNDN